jgi:hypothetical protein
VSESQAEAFATRTEELLALLERGRLALPPGVEITDFVLRDGRVEPPAGGENTDTAKDEPIRFSGFKEQYREAHGGGAIEETSLETAGMHLCHFEKTLGKTFSLGDLTLADLQRHVNERRKKKYRGRPLSPVTLRKEVASFRAAWNWASLNRLVKGPFPSKGLIYPKADEQPPYMTLEEIERRLRAGGDSAELWDCLYLRKAEIEQLLADVKSRATAPWLSPMVAMVAVGPIGRNKGKTGDESGLLVLG